MLASRAAEIGLKLSSEEREVITAKRGASSPQFLVLALRYIKLRRDAGHDAPWLDQLPASTVELVASDGGLLAFLEHAHGSQMIKCLSTSLISFPALCCFDICRLCEVDGVEITKESASNALDVLQSCGLTEAFFFPSIPGRQVCAVHSKEVTRGLRDRYCIAEQKDLQLAHINAVAFSTHALLVNLHTS